MLNFLLFITAAQAGSQQIVDFSQLQTFLTFTRTPSGLVVQTEVRIGTFPNERFGDGHRPINYWFYRSVRDLNRREQPAERSYANTDTCANARQALFALESVTTPQLDVQFHGREPRFSSVDGVVYELAGTSLHPDGQNGSFSLDSTEGSPAARWVDRMLAALEDCWRPLR